MLIERFKFLFIPFPRVPFSFRITQSFYSPNVPSESLESRKTYLRDLYIYLLGN